MQRRCREFRVICGIVGFDFDYEVGLVGIKSAGQGGAPRVGGRDVAFGESVRAEFPAQRDGALFHMR